MPNKRDIKLDQYNISVFAYRELHNFCLQYPEKKLKLIDLRNPLQAQQYSDMPHSGAVSDPTMNNAVMAAALAKDVELIEQVAIQTDSGLYRYILLNVTENIPYYCLKSLRDIPCGKNEFYKLRRLFFYNLHQIKK